MIIEEEKRACRKMTKSLISKKLIAKHSCAICGNENAQIHHNDYSDPFDITWLCFTHHRLEHDKAAGANRNSIRKRPIMTQTPKKSLNTMIDADLYDAIKSLADSQGRSIKSVTEAALNQYLDLDQDFEAGMKRKMKGGEK